MKVLEVVPTQPLSISATAIGGADFFTLTRPMATPLLTTILGALGSLNDVRLDQVEDTVSMLGELCEKFMNMFKCDEPIIFGPLLRFRTDEEELRDTYAYLYPNRFLPIGKLRIFAEESDRSVVFEYWSDDDSITYDPLVMIGVSLERRSIEPKSELGEEANRKVIRYGLTYKYPLAIYRMKDGKVVEPIYTYLLNCNGRIKTGLVRLGGEGRIANINLRNLPSPEFSEKVKNPLSGLEEGYYIALSQIPLLPLTSESTLILQLEKFEVPVKIEDVIGIPQVRGPPKIKVERLGLGFSEVTKKRRPQILALPSGTIIRVTKPWAGEYSYVMRTLLRLGFSSFYKLR